MEFLSDLLLAAAALGAAAYCGVLSRRLKALATLEGGMGSAIAILSGQVDELSRSLRGAQEAAGRTGGKLEGQTARAEAVARRLELLVASMHDLPEEAPAATPAARPPSPWPAAAGRRSIRPEPEAEPDDAPYASADPAPRTRILRRRHLQGAQ